MFLSLKQKEIIFKDFEEERKHPEEIVDNYCNNRGKELVEIIKDEKLLREMLEHLVREAKVSKNSLEKVLNISRFRITKLLKV